MATRGTRSVREFDVVIIGSGAAGFAAAEGARAGGAKSICIIEREDKLGGECIHWACAPIKSLLRSARMYYACKHVIGRYGVNPGRVTFDYSAMRRRRDAVIRSLTGEDRRLVEHAKHLKATVIYGTARFTHAKTIEVNGERIHGRAFVIATGSRERAPVVDGIDTVPVSYSHDFVTMTKLPSSVVILGGGAVGCEYATFFALLGIKTTILEYCEHILAREDAEIAALAEERFRALGVSIVTKAKPLALKRERKGVRVTFQVGRRPRQSVVADKIFVATGRLANVDGLGLERAGVRLDDRGCLIVAETMQTTNGHIFAAGDVTSRLQFTHVAHHEGYIAGWNAAMVKKKGDMRQVEETVVPRVTYLDPEVASVGMTLEAAAAAKKKCRVYRFPFSVLGRAIIDGHREGMVKIIVDAKTQRILGAHALGERAGEVIHELALAMYAGIPMTTVRMMLHAYPSWSESIPMSMS